MYYEKKIKHIEIIEQTITRMSQNSFLLKGWSITILSAVIGFSSGFDKEKMLLIAAFLNFMFWVVDAFYLSKERQYRGLYDDVIRKNEDEIDFSMSICKYKCIPGNTWFNSFFSKPFMVFYGGFMVLVTILVHINNNL